MARNHQVKAFLYIHYGLCRYFLHLWIRLKFCFIILIVVLGHNSIARYKNPFSLMLKSNTMKVVRMPRQGEGIYSR